jgi:uncharacterized protein (DUF1501 family)
MPRIWLGEAQAQTTGQNRRILVVIQLAGGDDGLNTVIPFTDARYHSLRPALSFKESELKDDQGVTTIIDNQFGLHPELGELKTLYDQNKMAIVLGVGYPNPNLSHFSSMAIWHTGDLTLRQRDGWLGRYADLALAGKSGLSAVSIGGSLPQTLMSSRTVVPSIANFATYDFQTDPRALGDRSNRLAAFATNHRRSFPADQFLSSVAATGLDAVEGAQEIRAAVATYSSTVTYPAGNPLANALRMAAQVITTIDESVLLYVQMGGFDNHSSQIDVVNGQPNKLAGDHARLLKFFSESVKAFYDDMAEHGLVDRVVILEWSEFGRRPNENASFGTDHGTSSQIFVIGDPVRGGLYGEQPSLAAADLDRAGNLKFNTDFRAVYGTVLDRWLGVDSNLILGSRFEDVGFLS